MTWWTFLFTNVPKEYFPFQIKVSLEPGHFTHELGQPRFFGFVYYYLAVSLE
jgi:hypothetical protein